jgi:endo-1,4-beta-D-glucanase Y
MGVCAATDGDIDVASSLVVAHWQWPEDSYGEEAKKVIGRLKGVLAECVARLNRLAR